MALAAMVVAAGLSPLVAATGVAVQRTDRLLGLPGSALHLPTLDEASTIYAANGSVLARVHLDQNRQIVPLSAVNALTRRAVLDIEDHGFYQHGPLDARAIVRALVADLEARTVVEGGSTISQQLAKNLETGSARTLGRKLAEARDAAAIERTYTKDQILEMYLNRVYYGHGAYGLASATKTYFGRDRSPKDLSPAQAAFLAGLLQAPNGYDPKTNWDGAPALADKSFRHDLGGREFDLYYAGSHLHMVVLHAHGASYWVVNTLLDSMSNETMLAIAKGLKPLHK